MSHSGSRKSGKPCVYCGHLEHRDVKYCPKCGAEFGRHIGQEKITGGAVVAGVSVGGVIIAVNHLLAGCASWWVHWCIGAVGWIIIASVVIPFCERVKRGRET